MTKNQSHISIREREPRIPCCSCDFTLRHIPRQSSTRALTVAITLLLVLQLASKTFAKNGVYSIVFSGSIHANTTHDVLAVGSGHAGFPDSNWLSWLQYLGPLSMRYFINSINNWKNFVNSRTPAYGTSFSGRLVGSREEWDSAVAELRGASSTPGSPPLFDWILLDTSVRWKQFISTLVNTSVSPITRCTTNAQSTLTGLASIGIEPLVVLAPTCDNHPLTSLDPVDPEYWKSRWELYRWTYLLSSFTAENGVSNIELYNEPDLDSCLTGSPENTWLDEVRVRGLAVQDAYADHASRHSTGEESIRLNLIAPPMSAPKFDVGNGPSSFGRMAVAIINSRFPGDLNSSDPNWWNFKELAYHQYNTPGYGMRSAFDKMSRQVRDANGKPLPLRITEHSCYSASAADATPGDVMHAPNTAACVAGQVIALTGRAAWTSLQKFTQTFSNRGSGVTKNGVFWGEIKADGCDIGGSTRTAEAYRLLLSRSQSSRPLYSYTVSPKMSGMSNFTFFMTSNDVAYYFYSSNNAQAQSVVLALGKLRGIRPGAPIIISAVTSRLHGEISSVDSTVPANKNLTLFVPRSSVLMITLPRVELAPVARLVAVADTMLTAGDRSLSCDGGIAEVLTIHTPPSDASNTSVVALRFDLGSITPLSIVSAVLQVTSTGAGPDFPQILTVFGIHGGGAWEEATANWNNISALKVMPSGKGVHSIATNFINWKTSPSILGHVTGSTGGRTLGLDITDYLIRGGEPSFLMARLFRYDRRGDMAGDSLGGAVHIASREAGTSPPTLLVWTKA